MQNRKKKRHRFIEQSFILCGRRRGWDVSREQHWNMYIIICETDRQARFNAWDRVLRAGALGWPRGKGCRGKWEGGSRWGTHVNPWLIHVNVWQKPLQYCKVISLQLIKINEKQTNKQNSCPLSQWCHPTISFLVIPFPSCLQHFPASGSSQMSQLFASGGQSIGVSVS